MTIQFKTRVYKTEKCAKEKYNSLHRLDLEYPNHSTHARLEYHPSYKMWTVTQIIIYEGKKRGRKRKRKNPLPIGNLITKKDIKKLNEGLL